MFVRKAIVRVVWAGSTAAVTLAAVLVAGALPANAGPRISAEAITSSDGSRPAQLRLSGAAAHGSASFAGTGKVLTPNLTAPSGGLSSVAGGAESVFGPDDRIRINPTTSFPASAVVMITLNGNAHCTGWLYGPDIVATAGHCVNAGSGGAWYTSGLVVWPGRNGTSAPYGSCTVRTLYSVAGWTVDGNEEFDYGALKLNCTVGNTTGWFGYWWQAASLAGTSTLINGYPGEKPFGEQWRGDNVARTVAVSQTNQVFYSNDTTGGMSGSAVYQFRGAGSSFCTGYCSMAIHAYGFPHGAYPHNTYNHGTRITQSRFNNLQAWKAAA